MKRLLVVFLIFLFCFSSVPKSLKGVETLPENTKADTLQWTAEYVKKMEKMGVFDKNDILDHFNTVTRGDFIRWLVKAKKVALTSSSHSFEDVDKSHQNYPYIMTAVEEGFIEKTNLFHPDDLLIRADASIWLVQAHSETAQTKAKSITEPLIPAQDGYFEVPDKAVGALTVCYLPEYQMMEYRHKTTDDFRYIQSTSEMILGEAAHSLYMLTHPPVRGDKLIVAVSQEPQTLFSGLDTMSSMTEIMGMVYESSIGGYDEYWSFFPVLIKRIPTQENGLWLIHKDAIGNVHSMEVIYELRNGLKWSDGAPITTDDALFSYYMYNHPSFPIIHYETDTWIDNIEAIDDLTIKVTWNTPYLYCTNGIGLMPRHYFEEKYDYHLEPYSLLDKSYYDPSLDDPSTEYIDESFKSEKYLKDEEFLMNCIMDEEYNTNPIHAGPYQVSSWKQGKEIILEANDNYLFGTPLIKEIEIKIIENTNTMLSYAKKDKIDMTFSGFTFNQALELNEKEENNHRAIFTPSLTWEHIDLNVDDPVLSDIKVRKALLYAIDRQSITDQFFYGAQPVAHAWLPPRHKAYEDTNITKYEWNPNKSATLLDEAGWKLNADGKREKEGEVLTITFMTTAMNKTREIVQAVISSSWKELGIEVITKNEQPTSFFNSTLRERDFDGPTASMYAWIMSPASNLYSILHSDQIPTSDNSYLGQNYTGYQNEIVDRLLLENLMSLDMEKIYTNLRDIQKIVTQDLPSLPLYYRADISSVNRKIMNFKPTGTSYAKTWNAAYWYWLPDEPPPAPAKMLIDKEKEVIDFGNIRENNDKKMTITLQNIGESLLEGTIQTEAPYLVIDPLKFSIAPNSQQSIYLSINVNAIAQAGPFNGEILIQSNDPELPNKSLPFQGTYGSLMVLTIGKKSALLNSNMIELDVPPIIIQGRTLVPLRFIGESFGAEVKWFPDPDREIVLSFSEKRMRFWVGKPVAVIESIPPNIDPRREIALDVPPQIIEGRTLVPLRFIAENMEAKVEWDATEQTITIWFIENHAPDINDWSLPVIYNVGEKDIKDIATLSELLKRPDIKYIILNFWASWSFTTFYELPHIEKLYQKYKDKGLLILSISIDNSADLKEKIIQTIKEMEDPEGNPVKITYPILWNLDQTVRKKYNIYTIPADLIIDKNLKVIHQQSGFTEELIEDLDEKLRDLFQT